MKSLEIKNERICYEDIGEGLPIIFIHPPGMGRKVFYEQKALSNHFRIILPDLAGHGDSSYNDQREITIERYGEDIMEFMNQLELESAVLFGYSSGGSIAQYISINHPDRVKALILSGGYPIVDHWAIKNEHRLGIISAKKSKKFLAKVLAISHTKDRQFRNELLEHMYKANRHVWAKYYSDVIRFNCKEELSKITAPLLLLYGSKDDVFNTYIETYKEKLSNVEVFIINGTFHQLPTRHPDSVNQIVSEYLLKLK